ncbi:MAG: hypothetical protein J6T16_05925 [Opitutales bacterium]|nr:hypothetical protein [Opitutales bacterium]
MEGIDKFLKLAAGQNRLFTQAALARFCRVNVKTIQRIERRAIKKIREILKDEQEKGRAV